MWEFAARIGSKVRSSKTRALRRRRPVRRPWPEALEDRRLPSAALQPIINLSVPAQQGYTLPLNGSGTTDDQTFTVTQVSGDPNITASVPQGPFWTLAVQNTDPSNNFSGALTFQLFPTLTPNTVSEIEKFTNDGYYNDTNFIRIAGGFPTLTNDIVQGGATVADETQSSGQPGTPFLNESVQQLAFTGQDQLAMANAGVNTSLSDYNQGVNTNDSQFFITTTGSPDSVLGYNYTIFGQMVSGLGTLTQITQVPVQANSNYKGEVSNPDYPLDVTSASLSTGNPNGVLLIDTTQALEGESATFTVTAHDATDQSTLSRTFTVTVGAYAGPNDPAIDFKPLASPVSATATNRGATTITLAGENGYPYPGYSGTLTYSLLTQPKDGTISDFNASSGTFVYTPKPGLAGADTFQYAVQEVGPAPPIDNTVYGPTATTDSDPATVTVTVPPIAPTITWDAPTAITYGTKLGPAQLDATASISGTFSYSPAAGTILKAGDQTLSVTFTPTDTTDYTTATDTTTIDVAKAVPQITWAAPANIVAGTVLGPAQLDATADVPGTFTYSPGPGATLGAGNGRTLSVSFTPSDTADYAAAGDSTQINILPAPTPLVTVAGIRLLENKKHQVTEVLVTLSGSVAAAEADSTATYQLTMAGQHGSFTAKGAKAIKLASANDNGSNDTITLIPKKPFALGKKVQLVVYGGPPSGLQDGEGRYIDGNDDGQVGGNAVEVLSSSEAKVVALAAATPSPKAVSAANEIDVLLAESALDGLVHPSSASKHRG